MLLMEFLKVLHIGLQGDFVCRGDHGFVGKKIEVFSVFDDSRESSVDFVLKSGLESINDFSRWGHESSKKIGPFPVQVSGLKFSLELFPELLSGQGSVDESWGSWDSVK